MGAEVGSGAFSMTFGAGLHRGFFCEGLAGISVLTNAGGGSSTVASSLLMAILHVFICMGSTFKWMSSTMKQ